MNLIIFSEINDTNTAVTKIRDTFFQELPQEVKFADDYNAIIKYAIRQIDIGLSIDLTNENALNDCCVSILSKLGYYLQDNLIEQLWDGFTSWYNPVYHYFKHVLGFNDLPKNNLSKIDRMVREDLRQLLTLIKRYETTETAIKTYLTEGVLRGEHEDKIRLDFYFRCINERNIIVQYLTFDIEKRAFERSVNEHILGGEIGSYIMEYQDRPYKWWAYQPNRYFDYKIIDTSKHRLDKVPLGKLNDLEELRLAGNTNGFYEQLSEVVTPASIFQGILNYYVPVNNLLSDRKPIFEELKKLFEHEFWYGFTGLALPQVEGIFSDMTNLLKPDKKFSSLPNKVSAVRPFYDYHESTFDYFEYILPRLRNRFLHSGNVIGNDFKLLALDLLYDLNYILDVFNSLKDDQITLSNLLNGHLELHLISLTDFNKFFRLLSSLRQRAKEYPANIKLSELLGRWENFEKSFLSQSGIYELRWSTIKFELKADTVELFDKLSEFTSSLPEPIVLFNIKVSDLRKRFDELKVALGNNTPFYKDKYYEIIEKYTFLNQFKQHLKSFNPIYANELAALYKEEKDRDRVTKMELLKPLFMELVNDKRRSD